MRSHLSSPSLSGPRRAFRHCSHGQHATIYPQSPGTRYGMPQYLVLAGYATQGGLDQAVTLLRRVITGTVHTSNLSILRIGKPVFARVTLLHASFSGTMCVLYWMWVVRSAHSQVPSTRCMATASSQRQQIFYTHSMARVAHPSMSSFGPAAYLMLSLTCTPSFHLETAPLTSFTPARLSTWATRTPRSLKFSVSFARAGTSFSGVQDTGVSLELRSLLRIWDGRRCTKCTTRMQSAAACIPSRIKCR